MRGQRHVPAALYPENDPVSVVQEAGSAAGPFWTGGKPRRTGIRSPDRPAHSQSLYRLSYPVHVFLEVGTKFLNLIYLILALRNVEFRARFSLVFGAPTIN